MQNFEDCLKLASVIVAQSKAYWSPDGIVDDAICGDPAAKGADVTVGDQVAAYNRYLPLISRVTSGAVLPAEQTLQNASNILSPQQQALQAKLYQQYAPILNQIGQQMSTSNQQAQAATDLNLMQGAGSQTAALATQLDQQANPEYYANRALIGQGISNLVNSLGPSNALSGGERSEVERSLNRDNLTAGNMGVNSGIGTVQNAMTYGNALGARQQRNAQILGLASGSLPQMQSGVNTFGAAQSALGKTGTSVPQFGGSQLTGAQTTQQVGANTYGLGANLLGQSAAAAQNAQNINANRRDTLDRVNQTMSSVGSLAGGAAACCFIFMQAYNGQLPWYVRSCRDYYYEQEPRLAVGYKRMAKWLVPLMKKSKWISKLVNLCMIKPMTKYGAWQCFASRDGQQYKPVVNFWFSIWRTL